MRGTDNAALASVLGALADAAATGDPDSADTAMSLMKQIINNLIGAAGIGTWPAAAAPGNAVSIAEALRAVYDDTNELQTDDVPTLIAATEAKVDTIDGVVDAMLAFWNVFMLTSGTIGATGNDTTHLHLDGQATTS
jgi:flagellar hook-basal body complex protein FliE